MATALTMATSADFAPTPSFALNNIEVRTITSSRLEGVSPTVPCVAALLRCSARTARGRRRHSYCAISTSRTLSAAKSPKRFDPVQRRDDITRSSDYRRRRARGPG